MKSTGPQGRESGHGWLLRNLIERVPYSRAAVLLSSDGLATVAHGIDPDEADRLAAIASALFSIARSAGARFSGSDGVRQVVAELDDALLFVSAAGHGSVLTVLADRQADAGVLGYEMLQVVKGVRPVLGTPARGNASGDPARQA